MDHHVTRIGPQHGGDLSLDVADLKRLHSVLTLPVAKVECVDAGADGIADEQYAVR